MKKKQNQTILALVEGAAMAALAVVLQLVMSFIPGQPQGGSISIAIIPIIYYAYRRGTGWGLLAGIVVDISYGFIDPRIRMGER